MEDPSITDPISDPISMISDDPGTSFLPLLDATSDAATSLFSIGSLSDGFSNRFSNYSLSPAILTSNNISDQMIELIFAICMSFFGLIFCYFGQKFERTIFFLCGFFFGIGGALYLEKILEEHEWIDHNSIPNVAFHIITMSCGILCGYITQSLIRLAMITLGFTVGMLGGVWIWNCLDTVDWWHDHVSKDQRLPIIFHFAIGLLVAILLQTKRGTDLIFVIVTAILGSYVFTIGVNELFKVYGGLLFCVLWTPEEMLKFEVRLFKMADEHFWILFAVWIFLASTGGIVQWRHRNEKRKNRRSSIRDARNSRRNSQRRTYNGSLIEPQYDMQQRRYVVEDDGYCQRQI